jgi:effector-binding domain-containing protein
VVQVAAENSCWQSIGLAVLPCLEPLRKHTAHVSQLLEASWLWPLAGRKDRQIKIERVQGGGGAGKEQVKLSLTGGGGEPIGTLLVDGATDQVVGLEMQTTLGGKTGAFVGTFGAFQKTCGIMLATERRYTFLGQPFATEKLGGVICEKLDDKLFVQPEQVKHGTVEPKVMASTGLICTKLKGALSGVDAALATVVDQAQKKDLAVTGAAVLIHRKGPPQVKRPEQYVTDVCLPVDPKVWLTLRASEWKGTFFLGELADQRVVAAYGIGDLDKTTAELPTLLVEALKQRAQQPKFPAYQFVYTRAADFPPERRVSEMQLPVDE